LKNEFGLDTELVGGGGGVFEVVLDGRLVFSKKRLGRFPYEGEVASTVGRVLRRPVARAL